MSPVTDPKELLRLGVATLLSADTTLQALMGRATDIVREPNGIDLADLPALVYDVQSYRGADQRAELAFTAFAEDSPARTATQTANEILERVEQVLDVAALESAGLDAVPLRADRAVSDLQEEQLAALRETAPTIAVEELTLTLLVFD